MVLVTFVKMPQVTVQNMENLYGLGAGIVLMNQTFWTLWMVNPRARTFGVRSASLPQRERWTLPITTLYSQMATRSST
jgi:hypothetical protein